MVKYLPRLFEAIKLPQDEYKVVLKTGHDASNHSLFCMRTGIKTKTASGKPSDAVAITIAGKLLCLIHCHEYCDGEKDISVFLPQNTSFDNVSDLFVMNTDLVFA